MATATNARSSAGPLDLRALLENGAPASQIAGHLDALPFEDRRAEVLSLRGKALEALYDAVADAPALTLEDIVPAAEKRTLIYYGRNSLPLFSSFQKRFARVKGGVIVGYNHQDMSFVTGPGLFVVQEPSGQGEHANEPYFDYTAVPPAIPEGFPAFVPNEKGFSRLVYKDLLDYMRPVAKGAIVGRAWKRGSPEGSYFVLIREV